MSIAMITVDSSQIHSIGLDAKTNTLAIRFYRGYGANKVAGSLYHYANFQPDEFEAFKNAESLGKYFGAHIKPATEKHPFTRIEDAPTRDSAEETK